MFIPSYYKSSIDRVFADVVSIRANATAIDLVTQNVPQELTPDAGNSEVSGIPDQDVSDGRTLARKRVKGAGVSLSKGLGQKTPKMRFIMSLLSTFRRMKMENSRLKTYPTAITGSIFISGHTEGSQFIIDFEFGGGDTMEQNSISLDTLETDNGIVISKIAETGIYLSYFKNLVVYPNPADKFISISYEKLLKGSVAAELTDLSGISLKHAALKEPAPG